MWGLFLFKVEKLKSSKVPMLKELKELKGLKGLNANTLRACGWTDRESVTIFATLIIFIV